MPLQLQADSLRLLTSSPSLHIEVAPMQPPHSFWKTEHTLNAPFSSRRRNHQRYGDDPEVPFELQAERLVGAWFLVGEAESSALRDVFRSSQIGVTFGWTRQLPFPHVTEFLRAACEQKEPLINAFPFFNMQARPASPRAPHPLRPTPCACIESS